MKKNLLLGLILFTQIGLTQVIPSQGILSRGGESGGGGDSLEIRFDEIRADILLWVQSGGSEGIDFPSGITKEDYDKKMQLILKPKAVQVTFLEKDDEKNKELQVSVDGKPKTCRGFYSSKTNHPTIICNISRFRSSLEAEQYQLVHHEFASLVNLEKNEGAISDYSISLQMTSYLKVTSVLKLALKKVSSPCGLVGNLEARIRDCSEQKGNYILVHRDEKQKEIYQDTISGLIWSNNPYTFPMSQFQAKAACINLKQIPEIVNIWRLPGYEDYKIALKNGIRSLPYSNTYLWTSFAAFFDFGTVGWAVSPAENEFYRPSRMKKLYVRCIANIN